MESARSSKESDDEQHRVQEGNKKEVPIDVEEEKYENSGLLGWWGYRHTVTVLAFWAIAISYTQRVDFSLVTVAMTDRNLTHMTDSEYFDWDSDEVNTILSSFFWGYIITQIPAGLIAERFGPKLILTIGVGLCSVITLLSPVAASAGLEWLCVCNVIQGLGQGVIYPSLNAIFSRWAPPKERGKLAAFAYAGAQLGTVIVMPIGGELASTKGAGWPSIFYLFGAIGLLWTILWILLASSSPEQHRWISAKERDYILHSEGEHREQVGDDTKHLPTPWKDIWTSLPFWAVLLAHCGQNWGFCTLLTEMPTYMNAVLHFDIHEDGMLSALPYLTMWIVSIIIGWVSDKALTKGWITLAATRRIGNSIAHWGPALTLIGLGFVPNDKPMLAVGLLVVAVGLNGVSYVGFQVNHLDLSPNFAGTLMGITNSISNIMGIIAPITAGKIAHDTANPHQWRIVFFVSAAVYFVCNLFFIIFGSVEKQPWNNPLKTQDEESPEEQSKKDENEIKDNFYIS